MLRSPRGFFPRKGAERNSTTAEVVALAASIPDVEMRELAGRWWLAEEHAPSGSDKGQHGSSTSRGRRPSSAREEGEPCDAHR